MGGERDIRAVLRDPFFSGGENIQRRGGGGGAGEIEAGVSAGLGGGDQLQKGGSAGASGPESAGVHDNGGGGGGVGVPPAADLRESEEIHG